MVILFSGMIAAHPHQGGATWAVLQYLLGLRRLGHEVFFVEPVKESDLRPIGAGTFHESENAGYFAEVMRQFAFERHSALLLEKTQETIGLAYAELLATARSADLLINISGMLTDPALLEPIPCRAYLDLDPAYIQLWQSQHGIDMRFGAHTHFITIGQGIGTAGCAVPTCGLDWIRTAQPLVLEEWPVVDQIETEALTTIGHWRGYGSVEFKGEFYGQKAHSLRNFFELPRRTSEKFALALAIHPDETKDLEALAANGWAILDPAQVAATPARYRHFVQGSKGEFGITKSGYVRSHCGWFSDRSVCYLASGRPVLAQETGFSDWLPAGEGLFPFATVDDVLRAITAMNSDYPKHARAARALAAEYFDSDKVLSKLIEQVGTRS